MFPFHLNLFFIIIIIWDFFSIKKKVENFVFLHKQTSHNKYEKGSQLIFRKENMHMKESSYKLLLMTWQVKLIF